MGTPANDEQVYDELLGVVDLDPVGQAWRLGNAFGPAVPGQHSRPFALPSPHASFFPGIDELVPPAFADLLAPSYDPVSAPMAALPFDPTFSGDDLFNIHSDAYPASRPAPPAPPDGECNFLYYTPGTDPVKCGCRRFWSSNTGPMTVGEAIAPDPYQCMCSHHACYHDYQTIRTAQIPGGTTTPSLDHGKGDRLASAPLQDISVHFNPGLPTPQEFPGLHGAATQPLSAVEGPGITGLGPHAHGQASPGPEGSLPDTLCWGGNRRSPGAIANAPPPVSSQSLVPSRPSSVAESSQSRYLRPFAGKGLHTLSGVRSSPTGRLPLQERTGVTEPAMPRVVEEPPGDGTRLTASQRSKPRSPGHNPSQDLGDTQPFSSYPGVPREAFRNLSDAIEAHEQRLDRLENVSFSVAGHEDCADKNDQMDLRVTELESRVDEVERGMNDGSSHATARASRSDRFDGSTCSVVSDSTNATTRPMHSFEIRSQLQLMETRLSKLQAAALPASFETPWEVEVVFLPFPLCKIWQEAHDFKGDRASAGLDEWTQLPNTHSAVAMRAQSPFGGEWARDHDFEWLLPKACGPKGLVDRRLRSRGLIRTISVKGPDARSVQAAMSSVFGGVIRDISAAASTRSGRRPMSTRAAQFLGLSHEWVPLRKIHKDSRLRFLPPAEMVTPALWDVQFLNSVIMKSSEPRLFVTQPEAYVQDAYAYESGWTWQRLRELPRFYSEADTPREFPEADALEEHWAFNEQLDEVRIDRSRSNTPGPNPRIRQRMSSSPSQQYFTTVESMMRSSTPSRGATPSYARAQNRPHLPPIRTNSMPPSVPPFFSPSMSRRVTSNGSGQERQVIAPGRSSNTGAITKRRQTRSPSRARFTPRWSTKSPSPMVGVRSTTPFNYATPYSNGPVEPHLGYGGSRYGDDASGPEDFVIDIFDDGSFYDDDDDDNDEVGESMEMGDEDDDHDDDEPEDEEEDVGFLDMVPGGPRPPGRVSQAAQQLPEDEPWPGIEDRMSDGENVDPLAADGDGNSDMSSQPSEYPSTQVWNVGDGGGAAGFHIHEDDGE